MAMVSVSSAYGVSSDGGATPPNMPVDSMASRSVNLHTSPRYMPLTRCSMGWKSGFGCPSFRDLSHRVSGTTSLPYMPSSVLTMTWLASSHQLAGRSPNLDRPMADTGRNTPMLVPVPRMRPNRVDRCEYDWERRHAAESL